MIIRIWIWKIFTIFKTNSKLCEEVLGDDTFNDSLKLMLYLQNLEENVKKTNFHLIYSLVKMQEK